MRVRYAHLCDYALLSNDNKPSIIGIFNSVWTVRFPFKMSKPCVACICAVLENEDCGKTRMIEMKLLDPENRPLFTMEVDVAVGEKQTPGDVFLQWGLRNLGFAEKGPHVFQITIDGEICWKIELDVELRVKNG